MLGLGEFRVLDLGVLGWGCRDFKDVGVAV